MAHLILTSMRESLLVKKEFNADFVCSWGYVVNYVNNLLYNLNLYDKVNNNKATIEDIYKWYKIFYSNNYKIDIKSILINMSKIDMVNDYSEYRNFVISEVIRCKPFIDLHLDSAKEAVSSLKSAENRIKMILK